MGVDVHGLQILCWASRKSTKFGRVATIGRQAMSAPVEELRKHVSLPLDYKYPPHCEDLLVRVFGAERVDSFDNSAFEGCTYATDFNKPIVAPCQYGTVIDFGCLEHIYNVAQAFRNVSQLCEDGGQILHCLPANNYCGHGFWQFSPELFFSLYSNQNGYSKTQVFIASLDDETTWYEVVAPRDGKRVPILSDAPLYVICRTVKRGDFSHDNVQQSDYVFLWDKDTGDPALQSTPTQRTGLNAVLQRNRFVRLVHKKLVAGLGLRGNSLRRNPSLIKRRISELT